MRKVPLRKTAISVIENSIAKDFLNHNHRQKSVSSVSSLRSIGLFLDNELLAVTQFCAPRTKEKKRKYTTELLRMAFKGDVRIYRGASAMIDYYRSTFKPADIFTYQDTTGEVTKVYEHSGFTLVSESKDKPYLVAPGLTLETAGKRERYSMASVVMRGPDALLGVKLGEVFHENGKRKTNPELFIEELGWHIEKTSGDRVYEWVNPKLSFYTYKITAADSDKYYFGVSHVKKANATVEDCLNDGYLGSGGTTGPNNKFNNWKKAHKLSATKEVLRVYKRKAEAYLAEDKLVGESWKTDELCLNSIPGGALAYIAKDHTQASAMKNCSTHGLTLHRNGGSCYRCTASKSFQDSECVVHGQSLHRGDNCVRCVGSKSYNEATCLTHGLTLHQGKKCSRCAAEKRFSKKTCVTHGLTSHIGESCQICATSKIFKIGSCHTHGEVKLRAGICEKCSAQARVSIKFCSRHGETKHQGATCARCSSSLYVSGKCSIHGDVKLVGGACSTCRALAGVNQQECSTHGLVTHIGDKCRVCINGASVALRDCLHHGLVKHQGEKCSTCSSQRTAHIRFHRAKTKQGCLFCSAPISSSQSLGN